MRALNPDLAVSIMRQAGFEPKVPYPGAATPWLCRCMKCGKESPPRLSGVKSGRRCKHCARNAAVDPEVARGVLLARQLEPLAPYPGRNNLPWLCRCLVCGSEVTPVYANVQQGGSRACGTCKSATLRALRLSETSPELAVGEMRQGGFEPLEPFHGTNAPWLSRCTRCGEQSSPALVKVRAGSKFCCHCMPTSPVDPALAESVLLAAQLQPLVSFPGANTPWRCRCMKCGTEVAPTYSTVRVGGGCGGCNALGGFKPNKPAIVYLISHGVFNAVKVGIGNVAADRLDRHRKNGWQVILAVRVPGETASGIERDILDWWRVELGLPYFLSASEMPQRGWTETVDADSIDIPATVDRIRTLARAATPKAA